MDIKSKNSRKFSITVVAVIFFICSAVMLSGYSNIAEHLKQEEKKEDEKPSVCEVLLSIGTDLAEGSYLLYNDYSKETDPSEVLEYYGQRNFNLTEKYLDYELFDENGKQLLGTMEEEDAKQLFVPEEQNADYVFRVKYTFSQNGSLSDLKVDGTALDPEEEYDLETSFLAEAEEVEYEGTISSICTPADVTIAYGMNEQNLKGFEEDYTEWYREEMGGEDQYAGRVEEFGGYRDTLEILSLAVALAALLLPVRKKTDLSGMRCFQVPFEIPFLVLLVIIGSFPGELTSSIVYMTVKGTLLPGMGHGMELLAFLINFVMWVIFFGILFWAVTSLRTMIRMKRDYWTERTITAKCIRYFRRKGRKKDKKGLPKKEGLIRRLKKFFIRQYDLLQHVDFRNKTNRTILKIVIINYIILAVVCFFWYYGAFALVIYSALLFIFLRKYVSDLQEKYKLLLKSTNLLAEGKLDIPINEDMGLFNPIQEELKKIQKGFKKAVDEEVKNERMKTELVTNVSHDLRTPLTAIITYIDLLKNERDEEKRKEYISVLERKSLRLKVLIEDLFEVSKAASKNVTMHFVDVDIVDLIKQAGLENEDKIKESGLEFRWKLPEHKIIMKLDSEKTYRIFENLIVNITKYAMPRTRVYIEMTEQDREVHISMKNVSAAELNFDAEEITDRFVRGDMSRNTEGSGLGLAIAKSFVELQHGSLKISTEADLFKADIVFPKLDRQPE